MDEKQVVIEGDGEVVVDERGREVAILEGQELTPEQEAAILGGVEVVVTE